MRFAKFYGNRLTICIPIDLSGINIRKRNVEKKQKGQTVSDLSIETQWTEIIRVRLANMADASEVHHLFNELLNSSADDIPPSLTAVLYKSTFFQTDWSIHLVWHEKRGELEFSPLGAYLSQSLRALGIVNHSIWEKYS